MRLRESWKPATVGHYPTLRSALFVTGDDFLRLALQAHLAAAKEMLPPDGARWIDDAGPYACAHAFAEALLRHLGERVRRHAVITGHLAEAPFPDDESPSVPGAGAEPLRSAAKDGGASAPGACPPASAVGPASALSQVADITTPENPLFCASGMQRLPVGDQVDSLEHNVGETA
jgi:hypothetical protein